MLRNILALAVACTIGAPVLANGLGENRSWQFSTSADRANKAAVRDLIERKKAGYYESMNEYDIDYNIAGDYVNCAVSASTTGNQGSIEQTAPVGSPSVAVTPTVSSDASGNTSDASTDGYSAAWGSQAYGSSSSSGDDAANAAEQASDAGDTNSTDDTSTSVSQSNSGSSQNAEVSDSANTTRVGASSGDGGGGQVALNSQQGNTDSVLTASVTDSSACAFNRTTGVGN